MSVTDRLLDSDPSIRQQVMLSLQAPDGRWGGGAALSGWTSTNHTLWLLRTMGINPADARVRRAIALVRERVRWEYDDLRFFDGEVEPCINGTAVMIGAYFGEDVGGIVERLLGEQMADGGGTANRSAVRHAGRSTPPSASSKGCSSTSAPRELRRQ